MKRLAAITVLVFLTAAPALGEPRAWNGANPFNCELQQAGFEAQGPDPAADPYCVEFDKRRQNVTELGIVDFLSKEPARVGAAGDKCFYYQVDHWRSAVVQDDGTTAIYEWDGRYAYDRAKGEGGAYVENFKVNGRTEDPSKIPGVPPEYAQYMGPGTGGVWEEMDGEVEPRCVEKARTENVYASAEQEQPGRPAQATSDACRSPFVRSRRLGPVRIGDPEARVREQLGRPAEIRRGFLHYCAGGAYLVGQRTDRSGDLGGDDAEPTVMVLARKGRFRYAPGTPARSVRHLRAAGSVAGTRVWMARKRATAFGTRGGKVRWVAVYDRRVMPNRRALRAFLQRALIGG